DSIDLAEDRERFSALVDRLGYRQPAARSAHSEEEALRLAREVGFPLMLRPSYVLGGRAMEVVFDEEDLVNYVRNAVKVSDHTPVLMDRFLEDAIEVDVDVLADGQQVLVAGIMEHVEQAGIHSGDSGCSLPPNTLSAAMQEEIRATVTGLTRALKVVGLMNAQFAIQRNKLFILEVNPRASRTVPFVSKATGIPLAKVAARCMVGESLAAQGVHKIPAARYFSVKQPVYPFIKFRGVDPILGPEMKSTGEVMGTGRSFGEAYAKAQLGSGTVIPAGGKALLSVRDADKPAVVGLARALVQRGFTLVATGGTCTALRAAGVACERINKVREGQPHVVDLIKNSGVSLIVNTTQGKQAILESYSIRREAVAHKITYYTTIAAAKATVIALDYIDAAGVNKLQDLHRELTG
ncbi:MAG: ATP-grasp domain-containing protein, partial [Gammaproteobacteria bacterium]